MTPFGRWIIATATLVLVMLKLFALIPWSWGDVFAPAALYVAGAVILYLARGL